METLRELHVEPSARPLKGVKAGCLLRVRKSAYGLPDAPLVWCSELTGHLKQKGFRHHRLDPAFMTLHDAGGLRARLILHVDDLMVASHGSPEMQRLTEDIQGQYPFGEWVKVGDQGCVYTRRRIKVVDKHDNMIDQTELIHGRLSHCSPACAAPPTRRSAPAEVALVRSAVRNLHWATSQSRPDLAVYTRRLQTVQLGPTCRGSRELARVLKIAKNSADFCLRIFGVKRPCVAAWSDSSLSSSDGSELHDVGTIQPAERHRLHSQGGCFVTVRDADRLEERVWYPSPSWIGEVACRKECRTLCLRRQPPWRWKRPVRPPT